jgi:uncharacterized protein (DUF305 family)
MDADVEPAVEPDVEAGGGGDAEDPDAETETDLDEGAPGGLSWAKVAVLAVAVAFLGFAVGVFVNRDNPPAADSADVGFLQDMLTHHQQAVEIALLESAYGSDPTVRSFASDVLVFQNYEIGVMTQMLRNWGFTQADRSDQAMAWMDMPVPVDQMPGLLTKEQMDEISEARGADLDALFLDRMAEHHRGGIHMAEAAAGLVHDPDVRALAQRIARNQATEINEYRGTAIANGYDIDIPPQPVPSD